MSVTSVLLVGIGGQGTVFLSNILVKGLLNAGYDVKMSEIHGMAQRGGTVSTQVRYGDKVYSPIIGDGEADIMVAFEKQEALRYMHLLKPGVNSSSMMKACPQPRFSPVKSPTRKTPLTC